MQNFALPRLVPEILPSLDNITSTWMVFKTDNTSTGSSNNNQVKLPLESSGTYDMIVDWGDGTKDTITAYNQAEATHTYISAGIYNIKITGTCYGWRFNANGDRLKILDIKRWGKGLRLGNSNGYFNGCTNLIGTYTDALNLTGMTNMQGIFQECTNFNGDVSKFNTSNITNMSIMFKNCTNFNQPVSNFNTSKVTTMSNMFYGCTKFNQNLSDFNITSLTNATSMLSGSAFNQTNYDLLLVAWESQAENPNVAFHAGATKYSSGAPSNARAALVSSGWTITDGGASA